MKKEEIEVKEKEILDIFPKTTVELPEPPKIQSIWNLRFLKGPILVLKMRNVATVDKSKNLSQTCLIFCGANTLL